MVFETIGTQKIIAFGTPIHCFNWWRVTKWAKCFIRLVRYCHSFNLKCNNCTITFATWYKWLQSWFVLCNRLPCNQIYNVRTLWETIRDRSDRDRSAEHFFFLIVLKMPSARAHAVSYRRSAVIRYQKRFNWFMTKWHFSLYLDSKLHKCRIICIYTETHLNLYKPNTEPRKRRNLNK